MAYGQGWGVEISNGFQQQLDALAENEPHLEELVEGLIFTAFAGPDAIWPQLHMVGNLWCTRVLAPLPYLIFFEVNETERFIELVIITETP